jgi:hypothetical protein
VVAAGLYKFAPVGMLAIVVHGTSTADLVVLFAAIGWAVMIAKDIRPIKALRSDLAESRKEVEERDLNLAERDRTIAELHTKLTEEAARADKLAASRDFSAALADALSGYEKRAEERARKTLDAFATHDREEQKAWTAITAAIAALHPPGSSIAESEQPA